MGCIESHPPGEGSGQGRAEGSWAGGSISGHRTARNGGNVEDVFDRCGGPGML